MTDLEALCINTLADHLRWDLLQRGRIDEAECLTRRLLQHPSLATAVFSSPSCGKLPLGIALHANHLGIDLTRDLIEQLQVYLPPYGRHMAQISLELLDSPEALKDVMDTHRVQE